MTNKKRDDMSTKRRSATVQFEIKEIKEDSSGEYFRFKGLASTFGNVDFGGDIAQPKSFDATIESLKANARPIPGLPGEFKLLPILWQHNMKEPLGSFTSLRVTMQGLEVEGVMPKSDTFVSGRVIPQMRVGSVGELSIGYIAKQTSRDRDGNRLLEEIMLFEASLVTLAMNPKAIVTGMKGAQEFHDLPLAKRDHAWDAGGALGRVKESTNTTNDNIGEGFKDAFLYVSDPEDVDGYRLQVADLIDGKITIVPRAVFAAAAHIKATREFEGEMKDHVIDTLDQYYEKIGLDSPYDTRTCIRLDDLSALDERTLEKSFKSGVYFSGNMAKLLVKAVKSSMREAGEDEKREADQAVHEELLAKLKTINSTFNSK